MNDYEFLLFIVSAFLLGAYLLWKFKTWRAALLLLGVSLLPLYLSIERTSQFLTADAAAIIDEPIYISSLDKLLQWSFAAFRTTDVVFGALAGIQHRFFQMTPDTRLRILFKSIHWLLGFATLLAIYHLLSEHFVSRANKKHFFIIFIYSALLLPTNSLALKVFNYDALSLLLGILSILCILVGFKTGSKGYSLVAIVCAYLAAQEKLVASPILLLSLAVFGCLVSDSNEPKHRYLSLLWGLLVGISVALLVGGAGALLVARLRHWNSLEYLLLSVLDPLSAWLRPLVLFSFGVRFSERGHWLLLPLVFAAAYLLAIGLLCAKRIFSRHLGRLTRTLSHANIILAMVVFLVGIVGTYTVEAYLAPWAPISPGNYHPVARFNNATLHFGMPTLWQHLGTYIVWAYTLFVNAIPTVYWLVLGGIAVAMWIPGWSPKAEFGVELLLLVGLLMPLVFALLQIPVSARYLNIGLFLFVLAIILKGVAHLTSLSQTKQAALAALFAIILTLEVLPFNPLYSSFRPVWVNYDEARNTTATLGRIDPGWGGWGEEIMLAYQQIETWCHSADDSPQEDDTQRPPCASVHLYSTYLGGVLDESQEIDVFVIWLMSPDQVPRYTALDYYVVNRASITQGWYPYPAEVEPVFVISHRGYIQAWVFRGDDLQEAGFRFGERGINETAR